jgi:hypothetical protein
MNHELSSARLTQDRISNNEPLVYACYTGFHGPGDSYADSDGDMLMVGNRGWHEVPDQSPLQVLVEPDASPDHVARMLRKMADWIDREGVYRPDPVDVLGAPPF